MKTAIDNYELGKQKEVNADSFPYSFHADSRRFKCPECGEPVFLRNYTKTNSKIFYHRKKDETTKECDLRVDGKSNLSIYDRLGLPLYLRKNSLGKYYFAVSFRRVPENVLLQCEKRKAFIKLHESNSSMCLSEFNVDRLNFRSDSTTLLPIKCLPRYSSRLYISYSDNYVKSYLEKYWSEYINVLIPSYGALFSVEDNEGKIIRPGDNISTYTDYYWVKTSDRLPNYNGLNMNKKGQFRLSNVDYFVYKGSFDLKTENRRDYINLSNYLEDNLKVTLLEKKSTVIPLWPPCIKNDMGYETVKKTTVYCKVVSSNDDPVIHTYSNDFKNVNSRKMNSVDKITTFFPTENGILINVDKKLTSTGLFLRFNEFCQMNSNNPLVDIETGEIISGVIQIDNIKEKEFKSISPLNIIQLTKHGLMSETKLLDNNILISNIKYGDKYFLLSNKYCIASIFIKDNEKSKIKIDELNLIKQLKMSDETHLITMTLETRKLILNILKEISNNETKYLLNKYLRENIIPLKFYGYLGGKNNE